MVDGGGSEPVPCRGPAHAGWSLQRELPSVPPFALPLGGACEDFGVAGSGGAVADEVLAGEVGEALAVDAAILHPLPEPSAVLGDDGLAVTVASDDEGVAPGGGPSDVDGGLGDVAVGLLVPDAHLASSLAFHPPGRWRPVVMFGWDTRADRSHNDRNASGGEPSEWCGRTNDRKRLARLRA